MGREIRLFKSEERKSRTETAQFLRQIADKLEAGEIILRQAQEELVLQIPPALILDVQVEDEDKKGKGIQHSLELEIKWFDNQSEAAALELG